MACRAFKVQVEADKDPQRSAGIPSASSGQALPAVVRASRPRSGGEDAAGTAALQRTGSVVGIQIEVAGMYTGTLISDLMATVERVGYVAQRQQIADEQELHAIFAMQIPAAEGGQVFMGAA